MQLFSFNVNGIRSAQSKGLLQWLSSTLPDIVCFQEIKASEEQFNKSAFEQLGYNCIIYPSLRKGYSGLAVLSKTKPIKNELGIGNEFFDAEARLMKLYFDDFVLINTYFPSGTNQQRQEIKMHWLDVVYNHINEFKKENKNLIIVGDLNICRLWIDIHNPQGHLKDSGFLPEEREWFENFIQLGFEDTFRMFNNKEEQYTWWSYRAGARLRNKGWRIDYILSSKEFAKNIKNATILNDIVFSDHCPIGVDIINLKKY